MWSEIFSFQTSSLIFFIFHLRNFFTLIKIFDCIVSVISYKLKDPANFIVD